MRPFWVLLACVLALNSVPAAPPVVLPPADVKGEVSDFIPVRVAVSEADAAKFFPLDAGLKVFPADMLTDKKATVVSAAKAGQYRLLCYAGNKDGASDPVIIVVTVGNPPVITPPPVNPPTDPPTAPPSGKFFFLVVREAKPVPPSLVKQLTLPAWDELRKAGHQMTDRPVTELPEGVTPPASLPAVVTLEYSTDGKSSRVKGSPRPVPTTDDGVRGLLK